MTPVSKLPVSREALAKARSEIERMAAATTLDELEDRWKDYLHALHRSWNKLKVEAGQVAHRSGDKGCVDAVRTTLERLARAIDADELTKYLKEARHCEEHTIVPITERVPPSIAVKAAPGRQDGELRNVRFSNGDLSFEAVTPVTVVRRPAATKLLAVTTRRGQVVPPPKSHAGQPLAQRDPGSLAVLGAAFYEQAMGQLEAHML